MLHVSVAVSRLADAGVPEMALHPAEIGATFNEPGCQRNEEQAAEAVSHGRRARALTTGEQRLHKPREFTEVIAT